MLPSLDSEANAEFICRAVNSHEELLSACKAVLAKIDAIQGSSNPPMRALWSSFELHELRVAVEKAEAQP